jgi:hypothetical protein
MTVWMDLHPFVNALDGATDTLQSKSYSHTSPNQTDQFGYAQGMNSVTMNTPSAHATAMQYPQSANAMGYPWGATPTAYNSTGVAYNTPQTAGWGATQGAALGANFPFMNPDTTPSHMPKKTGNNSMATPHSGSMYSQYNQTEPRNFAPRTGAMPTFIPPPAFNLGRQGATKKHEDAQFTGQDFDPFMSPPPKGSEIHGMSQALVLRSVPENNQLALIPQPDFYGRAPAEIRAIRSEQLNKLTDGPTGLPTQGVALSPENFPFIESTIQAAPVGYGVVKIKNVSPLFVLCNVIAPADFNLPDPLRHQAC